MINFFHHFILSALSLTLVSKAGLEQKMVAVDADNKQVTLTLYHFQLSAKKPSIIPVVKNVGSTISKMKGTAAVTITESSGVSINDGKINFNANAQYILKDGAATNLPDGETFGKHTFILTNGKGSYTLGYAPMLSKAQLSYALHTYIKSNKFNFNTAILLETGHDCAFYKDNGNYHAYYLKELQPAKQMLMIK